MSADNGIYILETLKKGSKTEYEFRVAHLQAVENVYWHLCTEHGSDYHFGNDGREKCLECKFCGECTHDDCHIENAREMWSFCDVYDNEKEALDFAGELEKQFDYLEYGICRISIPKEF